jgi:ferric-dicitrate binding protein FerR (iron transport regulator)
MRWRTVRPAGVTAVAAPPAARPMVRRMCPTRRLLLAAPLLGLLPRPAAAARTRVGEVSAVTGAAMAYFSNEPPRPLATEAAVLMEDLLSTGEGARLACRLEGGIELRLGANASLRVDALTLRGARPQTALRGFSGPLLLDRPPGNGTAPITVTMPWARIGVRGTRVFAGEVDGTPAVFVARGRVAVEAQSGGRVELGEGEGVDLPRPGAPAAPLEVRRWGAARIARALALVE